MYQLGIIHHYGIGTEINLPLAVFWYGQAEQQGHMGATINLGECLRFGWGVEKDCARAIQLYQKAADQGEALGWENLGECAEKGHGMPKNIPLAMRYFAKASEMGYCGASYRLAKHCKKTDPLQAIELCHLAMEQDDDPKKEYTKKAKRLLKELEAQLPADECEE